jgi:AmmeMemoRadiSam system protein B
MENNNPKSRALGIIAPHAGYMYSGAIAGAVFGNIDIPGTVLLLGPNHHGIGSRAALYPTGEWLTPLGSVPVNSRLARLILDHAHMIAEDISAHQFEHSLEVQVPFLQVARADVTIVPLCLGFCDYESCRDLGVGVANAIKEYGDDVLIVASTDMSHYEPLESARKKDDYALRKILELDPKGLYEVVSSKAISMCGIIPATVMLIAALEMGATKSKLLKYATSGDISGDFRQVVGYAAVTVA